MGQTRYKEEMHVSATRVEVERSTTGLTARQNEEEIIESVEDSSNGLEENPVYEGKQECIPETSENPDRPQEINLQPVLGGFTEPYESSSQSGKTTRATETLIMSIFFTSESQTDTIIYSQSRPSVTFVMLRLGLHIICRGFASLIQY